MDKIEDFEVNSPRWLSLEDFEGEVWKPVHEYENTHLVSNFGRIKVLTRNHQNEHILKPSISAKYWYISLYDKGRIKKARLHRIVAIAFVPNPHNLPFVNHKDENKLNPTAGNLEWCTAKYNSNYGTFPNRMRQMIINRGAGRPNIEVHQYSIDGEYIATYKSQKIAGSVLGINCSQINLVLKNHSLSAAGYIFSYTKDENEIRDKVERYKLIHLKEKKHKKISEHKYKFVKNGLYPWCKPIIQLSLENIELNRYNSISHASRITGIGYTSISDCLYERTTKAGGYKWRFV